jgi:hypothetical protein
VLHRPFDLARITGHVRTGTHLSGFPLIRALADYTSDVHATDRFQLYMDRTVSRFSGFSTTGYESALWQGAIHLVAVYVIARSCTPWLLEFTHNSVLPLLTGNPARIGLQFFYSHLFAFSFVPGLVAGFFNAKLFRHRVVGFVWVIPLTVLLIVFFFHTPGVYPTAILNSDFKKAFQYLFGGQFDLPEYNSHREMQKDMFRNFADILRGTAQFRFTVPTYVAIAYSLGAAFSLGVSRRRAASPSIDHSSRAYSSSSPE